MIAAKEVVLAAGAIHSPQLLQLSGIGDPSLLKQFDISTVVNLPGVGANFQDHPLLRSFTTCELLHPDLGKKLTDFNNSGNCSFSKQFDQQCNFQHRNARIIQFQ